MIIQNLDTAIMITLALFSMVGSVFVATTILYSKKLQVHPQTLIAYTCMCEAISSFNGLMWTIDTRRVIDYLDTHQLFSWCYFFSVQPKDYDRAQSILTDSNDIFF